MKEKKEDFFLGVGEEKKIKAKKRKTNYAPSDKMYKHKSLQ